MQEVIDYIKQSRQSHIIDADIKSALLASGWDAKSVDESFNSVDGVSAPSNSLKQKLNLKVAGSAVVILLALGGYLFFANAQGIFPFGGPPSGVDGIYNAVTKASTIKSVSYNIGFTLKSQPRSANSQSMFEAVPALSADQQKYDHDKQRFTDLLDMSFKLRPAFITNKLPATLSLAGVTAKDPLGSPYQYITINGGTDYNLTITFETDAAITAIKNAKDVSFLGAKNSETLVTGHSVTFNYNNSKYFSFDGKVKLPAILTMFQTPNSLLTYVNGNVDIAINVLGDAVFGETNPVDTRFQVKGKVAFGDMSMEADVETLKKGDNYYFKVNKLPALFFDVNKIKDKWIQITPDDLSATGLNIILASSSTSSKSLQGQSNQTLYYLQRFFQIAHDGGVIKVIGDPKKDTVNGKTAYKYTIALDAQKFPDFYQKITTEFKDQLGSYVTLDKDSQDFLNSSQFKQVFDYLTQHTDWSVWLDRSGYPVQLEFSYDFVPEKTQNKTSDQEFLLITTVGLDNINQSFKYDIPADYVKYEDIQSAFSGKTKEEYLAQQSAYPGGVSAKARDAKRIADINQLRTAAELYFDDNGGSYPTSLDAVVPKYITIMPTDPTTNQKYFYAYKSKTQYQIWGELEGKAMSLNSDMDINSTGWSGTTINGSNESCAAYNGGLSRDCIYDLGQQ